MGGKVWWRAGYLHDLKGSPHRCISCKGKYSSFIVRNWTKPGLDGHISLYLVVLPMGMVEIYCYPKKDTPWHKVVFPTAMHNLNLWSNLRQTQTERHSITSLIRILKKCQCKYLSQKIKRPWRCSRIKTKCNILFWTKFSTEEKNAKNIETISKIST